MEKINLKTMALLPLQPASLEIEQNSGAGSSPRLFYFVRKPF
jgi:hypothetical protein